MTDASTAINLEAAKSGIEAMYELPKNEFSTPPKRINRCWTSFPLLPGGVCLCCPTEERVKLREGCIYRTKWWKRGMFQPLLDIDRKSVV